MAAPSVWVHNHDIAPESGVDGFFKDPRNPRTGQLDTPYKPRHGEEFQAFQAEFGSGPASTGANRMSHVEGNRLSVSGPRYRSHTEG